MRLSPDQRKKQLSKLTTRLEKVISREKQLFREELGIEFDEKLVVSKIKD